MIGDDVDSFFPCSLSDRFHRAGNSYEHVTLAPIPSFAVPMTHSDAYHLDEVGRSSAGVRFSIINRINL